MRKRSAVDGWLMVLLAFLFLAVPLRADAPRAWERWENCTHVALRYFDGDSFQIKYRGKLWILRLYGVDAPETDLEYPDRVRQQAEYFGVTTAEAIAAGLKAKELAARFLSQPFRVVTRRKDALGASRMERYYALVERDGVGLDTLLISAGLARATSLASDYPNAAVGQEREQRLRVLEGEAKRAGKGLWAHSAHVSKEAAGTAHTVNLNTATRAELDALPGIGPKLAEAIIAARPIKDLSALDAVPGIGPKKIEGLKGLVGF